MPKPRHRLRYWSMAALSVVTTLLGLLLIVVGPDGDTRLTGVMCLLFFGLGPLHYLGGVRGRLRLPHPALEDAWEAIDDVDLYEMPAGNTTVDMVGIDAVDPDEIVRPRWMAVIGRLGRGMSAYDLVVGADSFAGSGE
jgi:hypothetical protein